MTANENMSSIGFTVCKYVSEKSGTHSGKKFLKEFFGFRERRVSARGRVRATASVIRGLATSAKKLNHKLRFDPRHSISHVFS